jgi:hypothetical protein
MAPTPQSGAPQRKKLTAAGVLAFAYVLPFGYPWMHTEYHRSILSRFGYKSVHPYWVGEWNIQDEDLMQSVTPGKAGGLPILIIL